MYQNTVGEKVTARRPFGLALIRNYSGGLVAQGVKYSHH